MESWDVVRYKVTLDQSVYTGTNRYNYGPVWSYTIYLLNLIFIPVSTQDFHLVLAWFMVFVDISIFFLLLKIFNLNVSTIYFLSTPAVLISGFHIQIDNFSILFALIFQYFFYKSLDVDYKIKNSKLYIVSMLFLGISLSIKHIFIFYPIVLSLIFLNYRINFYNIKLNISKILPLVIPYLVFILSFVIDIVFRSSDWGNILKGINDNVLNYKSFIGNSFIFQFLKLISDHTQLMSSSTINFLISNGTVLFIILVFIAFFLNREKINIKNSLYYYLLVFYCFSPSLADQYLVIPLIPVIVLSTNFFSLLYLISSGLYLSLLSKNNINFYYEMFPNFQHLAQKFYYFPQIVSFGYLLNLSLSRNSHKLNNIYLYLILLTIVIFNLFLFYIIGAN